MLSPIFSLSNGLFCKDSIKKVLKLNRQDNKLMVLSLPIYYKKLVESLKARFELYDQLVNVYARDFLVNINNYSTFNYLKTFYNKTRAPIKGFDLISQKLSST